MPQQNGPLTREQVGEISFLLTKLIVDEIKSGVRTVEECATSIQIDPKALADYLEMMSREPKTDTLRSGAICPFCIIGAIMQIEHNLVPLWPYDTWKDLYRCTSCQQEFRREYTG